MLTRHTIFGLTLALMLAPGAVLWAKRDSTTTPAPAHRSTTRPQSMRTWVLSGAAPGVSRTPGPLITPGSPIVDRTTIAPFPIPGDTSPAAIARAKLLNIPREGLTLLEPVQGAVPRVFNSSPIKFSDPEPVYPKAARDAGIQGTVVVMAMVLADGSVGETRVIKSIPALDAAAVEAVKRMRFRPAYFRDQPFPDWLGIPVKFTLH